MLAATTGRDTIESWLRTDLVAIIMTVSGAHVLMRLTAFIAEQQILQVKSQAGERDDLSVLTTGAHRAAVAQIQVRATSRETCSRCDAELRWRC